MKRSKFTEEQILFALKQADSGQPVGDVCRIWSRRVEGLKTDIVAHSDIKF